MRGNCNIMSIMRHFAASLSIRMLESGMLKHVSKTCAQHFWYAYCTYE